jgi:integrase/recombinase XerD
VSNRRGKKDLKVAGRKVESEIVPFEPFDVVSLRSNLDGSAGTNRARATACQISAQNDVDALKAFLARYADKQTTFNNYRKEVERLFLWATRQLGKTLSSLTHEDLLAYQRFLGDPKPLAQWINANRKVPREHRDWRPFSGPLSPSSRRQAFVILNVMFAWLVNAGYLAGNPLSLSRQRSRKTPPRVTRYLDDELWACVKQTIDRMPRETERQRAHYFRTRWLFTLLYLGGLRVSEVCENTMGAFFARRDQDGEERWWLEVAGKGDKTRLVPATGELMIELARYRRESGLAPSPTPGEDTPLILPLGKPRRPLTRAALHLILKEVFLRASDEVRRRGTEYVPRADQLARASAHWLRHTAGSRMADGALDLRHVRDNLGHESLKTTSRYLHSDDDRRHKETEQKHRIDW